MCFRCVIEQWDLMVIKHLRFLLIKSNESVTEARSRSTEFVSDVMYEGRSINKFQNDVILLFFKV